MNSALVMQSFHYQIRRWVHNWDYASYTQNIANWSDQTSYRSKVHKLRARHFFADQDIMSFNREWRSSNIHRVSKKLCQLIFCSFSVKYEPISIKIARSVSEKTLNKTVPKMPTSPKYVLALPWETWSTRLSRQRNNKVHIWMIKWIATNITGSYCLLSLKKSHMSYHIIFITGCAQNVRLQHERKCIDTGATSQEHIQ